MNFWNNFAAKHPAAAKWVREGGLFVIVSNLITVFKYLLLQFLPAAFSSLPVVDFGWPGVDVTLFGETFKWNTKLRWIGKLMHSPMTMAIIYAQKYGSPPWAAS